MATPKVKSNVLRATFPAAGLGRGGQTLASANLVALSHAECWALLRSHSLGRLAIVVDGRPRIFPVNYAAGDARVVFRTDAGTKLQSGPGSDACFEIDDYNPGTSIAWSVMVGGILEDITEAVDERSRALRRIDVEPMAPGVRRHWLSLIPNDVSGRSFRGGWVVPGHYLG